MDIEKLVERQRAFFRENKTKELKFRLQALKRLEDAIVNNEEDLKAALKEAQAKGALTDLLLIIGPEGGTSEAELEAARAAGAVPVSLGRRILRAETAGLVAISAIFYETGDLGD